MRQSAGRLRELIERDEILLCPGVHDPLTAAIADGVDFEAIYMTGYGTSLSKTGYPDAGMVTMPEMIDNANKIQERIDVPLVADCDDGYGSVANVVRSVREYVKTAVAGIHIEDQKFPKRCGHTAGRRVVSQEEAVGKIRAACDVRDERNDDFVVIARTDARGAVDGSFETEKTTRYLPSDRNTTDTFGSRHIWGLKVGISVPMIVRSRSRGVEYVRPTVYSTL